MFPFDFYFINYCNVYPGKKDNVANFKTVSLILVVLNSKKFSAFSGRQNTNKEEHLKNNNKPLFCPNCSTEKPAAPLKNESKEITLYRNPIFILKIN
jgi:hypothetical protein